MTYNPVSLTLYLTARQVTRVGFGKIMLLSDLVTSFSADEIKSYASQAEVLADTDVDTVTAAQAAAIFAAEGPADEVHIAKMDYDGSPDAIAVVLARLRVADASACYGLVAGGTAATAATKATIEAVAAWAEAEFVLYSALTEDAAVLAGTAANVALTLQASARKNTFITYHSTDAEKVDAHVLSRGLGFNPDERAATWSLMNPISGFTAPAFSTAEAAALVTASCNRLDVANGVTFWGPAGVCCNGKSIKSKISGDWFKARLQENLTQLALDRSALGGEGIPYTVDGINMVSGVIGELLSRGVKLGHFASQKDEAEDKASGGTTIKAPWLTIPALGDIPAATRNSKRLPFRCGFTSSGEIIGFDGVIFFAAA